MCIQSIANGRTFIFISVEFNTIVDESMLTYGKNTMLFNGACLINLSLTLKDQYPDVEREEVVLALVFKLIHYPHHQSAAEWCNYIKSIKRDQPRPAHKC